MLKARHHEESLPCRAQRGAALLLVLLIVMTAGLGFLFHVVNSGGGSYAREQATQDALAAAKEALIGYAATYRDTHPNEAFGQLPCPDTDNTGIAQPSCGNAGETMIGRLPYKTLGVPDLRATDGECLWYIVSGSHKYNPKTTPLNWDTRGQIWIQNSYANMLADPNDDSGGAVAVIVAPGAPLAGRNRPGGSFPCSGDASNSIQAYLDAGYASATTGTLPVTAGQMGQATTNNDQLSWITAKELYSPIAKRNDLLVTTTSPMTTLFDDLKTCLEEQSTLPVPTSAPSHVSANAKSFFLGNTSITPLSFPLNNCSSFSSKIKTSWDNWKNQFGYVVCNNQDAGCLTVNGSSCRGALLFSGRQANGNPRLASDSFDAVAGNTFLETPNMTNYLAAGSNYSGVPPYHGNSSSQDIAICLKPDANILGFDNDFQQLRPVSADLSGHNMVTTDPATKTLTLGEVGLTGNATGVTPELLFGCTWFDAPIAFGSTLRAYYRYKIVNVGLGFTFTLADADSSRNPGTSMCGRGDASLGYSGLPNDSNAIPGLTVAPIKHPKIGLEIDTAKDIARNDPNTSHMAVVFWGDPGVDDDDNVHGAPSVAVPGSPQNPATVSRAIARNTNAYRYVRIEIVRTPETNAHSYAIKAWLLDYLPPDFDNLAIDFDEDIATAQIHTTSSIADLSEGSEALRNIRVGFTNAAAASRTSDQQIDITNFAIRTSP
jgi:hypothetical protein